MLTACSAALPPEIVGNDYFEANLDTTNDWIVQRTGIRTRHVLGDGSLLQLAMRCALDACRVSGPVDLVIVASSTPDDAFGDACSIAARLYEAGLATADCPAFDVRSACCGFVDALAIASAMAYERACVVGCDALASQLVDWTDRSTAVLFGDAAAAVVLESRARATALLRGFPGVGQYAQDALVAKRSPKHRQLTYEPMRMRGAEVFAFATQSVPKAIQDAMRDAGWHSPPDHVVLHQANARIVRAVATSLGLDEAKCTTSGVERYGNTGAASIPLALAQLPLQPGQRVVVAAFGAGPRVSVFMLCVGAPSASTNLPLPISSDDRTTHTTAQTEDGGSDFTYDIVVRTLAAIFSADVHNKTLLCELAPDSLSSMEFATRLEAEAGVKVERMILLNDHFQTVEQLFVAIERLQRNRGIDKPSPKQALNLIPDDLTSFEVTPLQHVMLFHHVRSKGCLGAAFVASFSWRVAGGSLRNAPIDEAWRATSQRHEALRSSFEFVDGRWPKQRTWLQLSEDECFCERAILDDGEGVRRVAARQRQAVLKALDQGRPHLARLALVVSSTNGETEETLVATFHHLVIDGISLCVVFEDLRSALQGKVVATPPPRWRDFAAAATMVDPALVAEAQRYYADAVATSGVPGRDRVLFSPEFDPDWNRIRATRRTRGGCCQTLSGSPQLAAIMHTAFLAAFDALGVGCIETYSATFATRYHRTGFARLVGPALNTVPLKNYLSGQPSFDAAVWRISNVLSEASRLAEVPLDEMKRCSAVPPPQVIFDFQGSRRTWTSSGSALWGEAQLKDGCILNDSAGVALSVRCVRDGDEFVLIAVSESPDIDRRLLCRIVGAFNVCLQCVAHGINDSTSPSLSLLAFAVELGDKQYNNDHHAFMQDNVEESVLGDDVAQNPLQTDTILQDNLRQAVAAELRIDPSSLDLDANLFSMGVDSLKAMRILAKCTQGSFNGLTLRHFFETPTIRGLASRGAPESNGSVFKEVLASAGETAPFKLLDNGDENDEAPCPLFGVSAAHFVGLHTTSVGSFEPISPQICWEWEIDNLDVSSFEAAWQDIVARHAILRSFVTHQGTLQPLGRHRHGVPDAVVQASRRTKCQSSSSAEFETAVRDHRDFFESGCAIGCVYEWPLFAFGVVETSFKSVVHVAMSLFLMDAVADNTFRAELSELYIAHKTGRAALLRPAPKLNFSRYAQSLLASSKDSKAYADGREFWTHRLADPAFPRSGPSLYSQKEKAAAHFDHFSFELNAAQWKTLRSNCVANGTTIPAALLAAYALALARHSEEKRFLINVLLCIRYDVHEDVLRTIGNCSSTILVDIDLTDIQLTLKATVARIAASLAASLEHSIFSGIEVMALVNRKKRTTYDAVAPFIFTTPIGIETCLPDEYVRARKWAFRETRFSERAPHSACVNAIKDDPASNGAHASLDILAELFPASLTASLVESYRFALLELSQSTSWASRRIANFYSKFSLEKAPVAVCRHPLNRISKDEHDVDRLSSFGEARHIHRLGLSGAALLHDALFRNASQDKCSTCPALIFDPCTLSDSAKDGYALATMSYAEVASKTLRLALVLANESLCDAMTDTALVGVVMQKSWKQVVAVHAILVQGCAYLPIDAKLWPAKRVSSVLRDSDAAVAVVDTLGFSLIDMSLVTCRVLDIDDALLRASPMSIGASMAVLEKPSDEATMAWRAGYVIYTSGSTGRPKGVVCHHFGAVNTIADLVERWRIESGDRILGLASLAFDLSVFDIFGATMACAALVLPSAEDVSPPNPTAWLDLARTAEITIWNSVPALLELTIVSLDLLVGDRSAQRNQVQQPHKLFGSLRLVFLSGDVVPPRLPARVVAKCGPKLQIVLMGGATEAAIWSNEFVVPANGQEPMLPVGWS